MSGSEVRGALVLTHRVSKACCLLPSGTVASAPEP